MKYAKEIASKAQSDLLFIPEESPGKIQHIFALLIFQKNRSKPFRNHSKWHAKPTHKLSCYYVGDFHKAYFPAATDQAQASLEKHTEKECEKFLAKFDLQPSQVNCRFDVSEKLNNSAEKIFNQAYDNGADLIVIGTKGEIGSATRICLVTLPKT